MFDLDFYRIVAALGFGTLYGISRSLYKIRRDVEIMTQRGVSFTFNITPGDHDPAPVSDPVEASGRSPWTTTSDTDTDPEHASEYG